MSIKFLNLVEHNKKFEREIKIAIEEVLDSGIYILGKKLNEFEDEFAKYCGAKYCIGVGNGLDALKLSLIANGIQPGDEVIVPAHTFIATWLAVTQINAIPIPVDCKRDSPNIDHEHIEKVITKKTRAIIIVHLFGEPANITEIQKIAKHHNLLVIEDAAQAHGALYEGKRIGGHGNTNAWSFYPGKNLGAFGDGGAITTNDFEISNSLRMLRNYGASEKYNHKIIGFNSRLDELQAVILNIKLKKLEFDNIHRKKIAKNYIENIKSNKILLPCESMIEKSAWHLFVIRSEFRHDLINLLNKYEIETSIHYPVPPHLQNSYKYLGYKIGDFPNTEKYCTQSISLPISPVQTNHDTEMIIEILNNG